MGSRAAGGHRPCRSGAWRRQRPVRRRRGRRCDPGAVGGSLVTGRPRPRRRRHPGIRPRVGAGWHAPRPVERCHRGRVELHGRGDPNRTRDSRADRYAGGRRVERALPQRRRQHHAPVAHRAAGAGLRREPDQRHAPAGQRHQPAPGEPRGRAAAGRGATSASAASGPARGTTRRFRRSTLRAPPRP